jgi:hypothetical protein
MLLADGFAPVYPSYFPPRDMRQHPEAAYTTSLRNRCSPRQRRPRLSHRISITLSS